MELKPLKKTGTFRLYRLKKFSQLNNKLLAELHKDWPRGATHAVFQFGEPIKNEWRVTGPLLAKYNVALIYTAKPSEVKVKKATLPEGFERVHLPAAKARALFKRLLLDNHKKIKKLGPAYKAEIAVALAALKKASYESLFRDGRPVTFFAKYHRKNYIGKNCEWMLTGWTDPSVPKRAAETLEEDFWRFAKKSRLALDFKTRSFSRQGQREARARGFKPNYVTVAKMP
ncbi:MAG: hypothetical protein ACYC2I_13335 [Elusimicrobiales bacterium]